MNSQTVGLVVAGVVFGLVCLLQLIRLATGFEVLVAGHPMPLWPNLIAAIVAGGLSWWMLQLARSGKSPSP